MIVTLGWPDKRLSPNARLHWSTKAKAVKSSREAAKYLTWGAAGGVRDLRHIFAADGPIPVKVTFYPPDNRRRDHDNLMASCKSIFDGIADALGVDDNRFRPSFDFAETCAPGRVEIVVSRPQIVEKFRSQPAYEQESRTVNGDRPANGAVL